MLRAIKGLRRYWPTLSLLTIVVASPGYCGVLDTLERGGAGDGKIAKYQFTLHEDMFVTSVAWSPDGKYIASASGFNNEIHLWDVEKRKIIASIRRDAVGASAGELSWSPDGRYLPVCFAYGRFHIYAAPNLTEVHSISPNGRSGCGVTAFSSDGSRFATLGIISRTLAIYSTSDWQLLESFDNSTGWARGHGFESIAYVPGTHTLAVGGGEFEHRGKSNAMNGYIYFYNPDDVEPSRSIEVYRYEPGVGPPDEVRSIAFSPDGKRVATGTDTGIGTPPDFVVMAGVRVLSVADGSLLGKPLDGIKQSGPGGLQYTFNDKYLVTGHRGAKDSLVHVINAATIQVIDAVPAGGIVYDVTTNPRALEFAAGIDKSIVVWSLSNRP
jgi:WD40 repeat protein